VKASVLVRRASDPAWLPIRGNRRGLTRSHEQVRHQAGGDIVADPAGQVAQDGVGIPAPVDAEVDVGEVQQADGGGAWHPGKPFVGSGALG